MLDPDGIVSSWNAGAQRIKGYEAEEIIGKHFSRFHTPEDREAGVPRFALEEPFAKGSSRRKAGAFAKTAAASGRTCSSIRSFHRNKTSLGFAKVTRDLTEQKLAQETLRRSQEQFRILVEGVVDYSIFLLDPNGIVSSWNAGAQRIKGFAPHEILGQHFSRFYTEEDRQRGLPDRALRTAIEEGKFEAEGWRVRKDGTTFWAHVILDAIRDEHGELVGFGKVTRDVTERRATQEALEKAREALFQSQKMDAIGQLTGGVAHDFNNLLTVIIGSLDLLKKRIAPTVKIIPLVDNALQAAHRGRSLTQRMLAFARRQEMNLMPVESAGLDPGHERSLGAVAGRYPG